MEIFELVGTEMDEGIWISLMAMTQKKSTNNGQEFICVNSIFKNLV